MALPQDSEVRRECYRNALRNWRYEGYVRFKERVMNELRRRLPHCSLREIAQRLHEYVDQGGEIDEQPERRPEWDDYEFHFDLRVEIEGQRLYFETLLFSEDATDPDDPFIEVVNVHDV